MGGEVSQQGRCCGSCDRQHQLRFTAGDKETYASWGDGSPCGERWDQDRSPGGSPGSGIAQEDANVCNDPCSKERKSSQQKAAQCQSLVASTEEHLHDLGAKSRSDASEGKASGPPERELLVEIVKKQPGEDLGMQVLHSGIGAMIVAEIFPNGAVATSNLQSAKAGRDQLLVHDLIVMINGVGGDDAAMAAECKRSQKLTLGVRRGGLNTEGI